MGLRGVTLRQLALRVGGRLGRRGIDAVLTGGACASIYSRNRFVSYDLDFVLRAAEDRRAAGAALAELGFRQEGRHYRHPETPFLVEFLLPPLSIGAEAVRRVAELSGRSGNVKLLSPTDCVKDRLAGFYFWNDRQSLDQAVLVAARQSVDLRDIESWSRREGMSDRFLEFRRLRGEACRVKKDGRKRAVSPTDAVTRGASKKLRSGARSVIPGGGTHRS